MLKYSFFLPFKSSQFSQIYISNRWNRNCCIESRVSLSFLHTMTWRNDGGGRGGGREDVKDDPWRNCAQWRTIRCRGGGKLPHYCRTTSRPLSAQDSPRPEKYRSRSISPSKSMSPRDGDGDRGKRIMENNYLQVWKKKYKGSFLMDLPLVSFLAVDQKQRLLEKKKKKGSNTLPWKCIPQGEAPICPPTGNRCCACICRCNSRKSLGHRNWRICIWNHARRFNWLPDYNRSRMIFYKDHDFCRKCTYVHNLS